MDNKKFEVMFSATKYFENKCYMREQPLILTYQTLLDKSIVHEKSLAYYWKSQQATTTTETNTIAAIQTGTSRNHCPSNRYLQ